MKISAGWGGYLNGVCGYTCDDWEVVACRYVALSKVCVVVCVVIREYNVW